MRKFLCRKYIYNLFQSLLIWIVLSYIFDFIISSVIKYSFDVFSGEQLLNNRLLLQGFELAKEAGTIFYLIVGVTLGVYNWAYLEFVKKSKWVVRKGNLFRIVFRLFSIALFITAIYWFGDVFFERRLGGAFGDVDPYQWQGELYLSFLMFVLICSIGLEVAGQMKEVLGPRNFKAFLKGTYTEPIEEERIFMFLDLVDSTKFAEILGHIQYSAMLKDAFDVMTDCIVDANAMVYQYIGDEIVFTWEREEGIRNNQCIVLYQCIRQVFESKRDYFMNTYGMVPFFKAGIHGGRVSGVEIGQVKKEIAFHGDVLNTSSRIQHMCKELDEMCLVSEVIFELLSGVNFKEKGEFLLRGKEKPTKVYALDLLERV
ncbi:MAG: adenylate/guanylate cyclase domain-containing protein [Cytophagales bacterium]|nr:adenylate/guanylate cyclase domain-containing protein [Cytophagales bacterium]